MNMEGNEIYEMVSNEDILVCEICGSDVERVKYNKHLKSHQKQKKVNICSICFKEFTNLSNFKYHLAHHSDERPFICSECPKSYKTSIDLLQHQRIHDKTRSFQCEFCDEIFKLRSNYNVHMRQHTTIKGPQKCDICSGIFINLRSHIEQVHQRLRLFVCNICYKEFGKKTGLERHIETVHQKIRKFQCDLCERRFGEKAQMQRHRTTHFKSIKEETPLEIIDVHDIEVIEDKKRYICGICKKKVNSKAALKRHKDLHERRWLCDLCPKRYGEKSNLMRHINTHIKIKQQNEAYLNELDNFNCKFCDKILTNKWRLKLHEKECGIVNLQVKQNEELKFEDIIEEEFEITEIPNYGDQPETAFRYECTICSATFKEQRYYYQHYKSIHSENVTENYPCSFCSETFSHRTQRWRHEKSAHLGCVKEKPQIPLTCELCDKKLSCKSAYVRHMKLVHENRRDFVCEEEGCDKTFKLRYELVDHIKKCHSEEPKEEIPCDICEKIFTSKKALYSHKKYTHEGVRWQPRGFQCNLCLEKFTNKYKKNKHFVQVHRNGEVKERICHHCNSNFQFYGDFKNHIDSHDDCVICVICGLPFTDSSALLIHQESHRMVEEDLKQFVCDVCSHRVSSKSLLQIHMRKHFPQTDQQYICDKCGKSYKFIAPFLHHQLVHENTFDFNCSHCDKKFRKKRDLTLHERIHTGERPYKCQICERAFALKRHYLTHLTTHEIKIWECKLCHSIFNTSAQLKKHETIVHPEEFPYMCKCGKRFKSEYSFESHYQKCSEDIYFGSEVCE